MLAGSTSLHASYEHVGVQPLGTRRMLVDQQQQRRATAAVAPLSEEKERQQPHYDAPASLNNFNLF